MKVSPIKEKCFRKLFNYQYFISQEIQWFYSNVLQFVPSFTDEIIVDSSQCSYPPKEEEMNQQKIDKNEIRLNNATLAMSEAQKLQNLYFESTKVIQTLIDNLSMEISSLKKNERIFKYTDSNLKLKKGSSQMERRNQPSIDSFNRFENIYKSRELEIENYQPKSVQRNRNNLNDLNNVNNNINPFDEFSQRRLDLNDLKEFREMKINDINNNDENKIPESMKMNDIANSLQSKRININNQNKLNNTNKHNSNDIISISSLSDSDETSIETKTDYRKSILLTPTQIKCIEEWTSKRIGNVIFDSTLDNWNQHLSDFDKILLGKQSIVLLLHTETDVICGCSITNKIEKINIPVTDANAFLFSFKNNQMKKFPIRLDRIRTAFQLFNKNDFRLCQIGMNDLYLPKHGGKISCLQKDTSSFDYGTDDNALIGVQGFHMIDVRKICVLQMI